MPRYALLTRLIASVIGAALLMASPGPVAAQNQFASTELFKTAFVVNDLVVTNYELQQRTRLLQLLRAPGDPVEEARQGLIDDRLRLTETRRAGITLTDEQVFDGMTEFAARANLTAEQFIAEIERAGVSAQTFRDFVSAGLAWRTLVQGRFGARSQPSQAEIDRAVALQGGRSGARVLLAEIVLPLAPQVAERNQALAARLAESITTESAFSAAARRYSASPTRGRGGRLDWLPIGNLPPQLRGAVLTLAPGETTEPISLGNAIGIFQLRGLEETEAETPEAQSLEYVTILFPGGRTERTLAEARAYESRYDTCDDLYTPAKKLPPEYFERVVLPAAEVPGDIALELAKLDSNEVSTALTRQDDTFLVYLMLCGRTLAIPELAEAPETPEGDDAAEEAAPVQIDRRAQAREALFNQRLSSFAESLLEELRADAIIVEK